MAGYSVTYSVVDQATAQINAINKRIQQLRAPLDAQAKAMTKFVDVTGLKRVAEGFKGIAETAASAVRSIGVLTPAMTALTGGGIVAGIASLVTSFADWNRELENTASLLDSTPEALSGVEQAARAIGVSAQTATAALTGLRRSQYEATLGMNPAAGYTFAKMGIALTESLDGVHTQFRDIIDVQGDVLRAFDKMPDGMDRAYTAARLLSPELADVFNNIKAAHLTVEQYIANERTMQTLTKENAVNFEKYKLSIAGLNAAFYDLGVSVAGEVAPALTPLIRELSAFLVEHKDDIVQGVRQIAQSFKEWAEGGGVKRLGEDLGALGRVLESLIKSMAWMEAHPMITGAVLGGLAGARFGPYGAVAGAAVGAGVGGYLSQEAWYDQYSAARDKYFEDKRAGRDTRDFNQFQRDYYAAHPPNAAPAPAGTAPAPAGAPAPAPAIAPTPGAPGVAPEGVQPGAAYGYSPITPPPGAAMPTPAAPSGGAVIPANWTPDTSAPAMVETEQTISHPERNNPGNLRVGPNDWVGKTTQPGAAFESFDTPEHGVRARVLTYDSYLKRGVNTIAAIANTSGPASDANNVAAEIAAYKQALGGKYAEAGGENLPIDATAENLRRLTAGGLSIEAGGQGKWLPKGYGYAMIDQTLQSMAGAGTATASATPAPTGAVTSTAAAKGVDPNLTAAVTAGMNAALPPGYTAKITSGERDEPGSWHAKGLAEDWQIYDPKGNPVSNRGEDTTGLYRTAAVNAYAWMMRNHPELAARMGWGGHFGTQLGGGGPPDLMHFDLGGIRGHFGDMASEFKEAKQLVAQGPPAAQGPAATLVQGGAMPNGNVDVTVTHKNAPANVDIAANAVGSGITLAEPRIEHQQFGSP